MVQIWSSIIILTCIFKIYSWNYLSLELKFKKYVLQTWKWKLKINPQSGIQPIVYYVSSSLNQAVLSTKWNCNYDLMSKGPIEEGNKLFLKENFF